ncbi:MAG: hypothetical protein IKN72_06020 [Clostridia bacterium]|nr:hypothetical protein [Clostridia bacterium]
MTEFTTLEKLQMRVSSWGSVLTYRDRVFFIDQTYKGFTARVYEFIDTTDEFDILECRLSLIAESDEYFPDSGHAVLWCFEQE